MEPVTYELTIPAVLEVLPNINAFVEEHLSRHACPMKVQNQILLSLEEAYVNVVNYAYGDGSGACKVVMQVYDPAATEGQTDTQKQAAAEGHPATVREMCMYLIDTGQPFDPLAKADPDITLGADERQIGGLGIFMIKKLMDAVSYERTATENILTMKKEWKI